MKNGQLKPAYNLQIGVNSEYIVGLDLFPNPTDVRMLIPFLSVLESRDLKFKQDIFRVENMSFNEETDTYTCANNRELEFRHVSKQKNKSGYILEKKVYGCTNCAGCPLAEKCKGTPHNKKLYVADNFLRFRKQSQI